MQRCSYRSFYLYFLDLSGTDLTADVAFASTGFSTGITSSTFSASGLNTFVIVSVTTPATQKVGTTTFTPKLGSATPYVFQVLQQPGEVVALTTITNATTPYLYLAGTGAVAASSVIQRRKGNKP